MTNRRSLPSESLRLSRRTQFTPGHVGGRVDSAQPVRRRKTVGAIAKQEVPPEFVGTASQSGDSGIYWYYERSAGDLLVAIAIARSAITPPSGWNSLSTGNVGSCYYSLAYGASAGGSANEVEGTFGGGQDCSIYGWALTSGTPSITYSGSGTATTTCPYGPVGSGVQPIQLVGIASVDGTTVSGYQDPDYSAYAFSYTGATGTRITGTFPVGTGAPDGPFPDSCDLIASKSSDFISFTVSV